MAITLTVGCGSSSDPAGQGAAPSSSPATRQAASPGEPARTTTGPDTEADAALSRAAWARVRVPDGRTLASHQTERLETPIHPGSLFKVIAARAALEQGLDPSVRIACPRRLTVAGRTVDCVHPDAGRPIDLREALAQSCNHYFVRLAGLLDRGRLEEVARRLIGRPFETHDVPLPLVVLGLEGPRVSLRTWARAVLGALTADERTPRPASIVSGLLEAAADGTAAVLGDVYDVTLAKTGTTSAADGGAEGVVVAWRPERQELVMVRAPGASGRDAARLARAIWDRSDRHGPAVRVGVTRSERGPTSDVEGTGTAGGRVRSLPIEDYVAGVVAGEGEASASPASLAAIAVAARSYAQAADGRHAGDGVDVCDSTHCQHLGEATPWSRAAAEATRGLVLVRHGAIVAVPYSAACSGELAPADVVWGGTALRGLTRVGMDPGKHDVPTWRSEVTAEDLVRALAPAGHRGDAVRDVRIVARSRAGLPTLIAVDGVAPGQIDATTFRHAIGRTLGWDVLKSHVWEVHRTGRGYRFEGRGKGHGVGLCVRGADVLGRQGSDAGRLLRTYLPGAHLQARQDHVVTVQAPAAWTAERGRLLTALQTALAETRLRLGVTAPRQVALRVHPTVQAYQRATGRAWWTAGSSRRLADGAWRIDLAPPAGATGVEALQTTLRHEVVHVLTADALALAPAWASEGLATLVSRVDAGRAAASEPPASCPEEAHLLRPGDGAQLAAAYGDAASCVAAVLTAGPPGWRHLIGR